MEALASGFVANEMEFQGDVLQWMGVDLKARPGLGIGAVGQEKQYADQKRSDLVIWIQREVEALAAVELKTLATPIADPIFQNDVIKKARRVGAPYCVQWNQRETAVYQTPAAPAHAEHIVEVFTDEPLARFDELVVVTTKDYVNQPAMETALEERARELLTQLAKLYLTGAIGGKIVDPTIFVGWLEREVRELRKTITLGVRAEAGKSKTLRAEIEAWAQLQGLSAPRVDILYERVAAQVTYRIIGQAVFYLAYSGHTQLLPEFTIDPKKPIRAQLESLWKAIRAVDYEALYAEDAVLDKVPLSAAAEAAMGALLDALAEHDWSSLDAAVLGAVFEQLIPVTERDLLGQYFTSAELADLIIAFCVDGSTSTILDPACGTGEFLIRSYDRLRQTGVAPTHGERLDAIWGVDISHFPTELAVINLCRQDFAQANNFPRVITSDFFDFHEGAVFYFPPAKAGAGFTKVPIQVPAFEAIVGNPPYVRWQKLDDLDPAYRNRVQAVAVRANVDAAHLLDVYVMFFIHAMDLLAPGGRVGFVTSSAWLATEYGVALQLFLLRDTRIVAIVGSEAEPFFPQAAINTVVTVVEKPKTPLAATADYPIRFVSVKETLTSITSAAGGDRWGALDGLVATVEAATKPFETDILRVRLGSRLKEYDKLQQHRRVLPWNVPMRAPRLLLEALGTDYQYA
jgi:methylase of polypeptide subunit release factors